MQYENTINKFYCPYCGDKKYRSDNFRKHVRKHHPEVTPQEYERYLVISRYPTLDIDALVQRYTDRLETMIGLQYKGLFIKKYLQTIGVARHPQADKVLMGFLARNPNLQTAEDVRQAFEDGLIGKFRTASPVVRFQGYLNRDIAVLEKKGQAELIEPITTLKTIKFIKSQLLEAREAAKDEETNADSTETT
jgi:hypothetical protein